MAIDSKNLLVWVKAMSRGQALPLDSTEIWDSLESAQNYAKNNATAYVGQTLKVVEDNAVSVYVIDADKTLTKIADENGISNGPDIFVSAEAPENAEDGAIWIDTDEDLETSPFVQEDDIVNSLTVNDATRPLSAAMGVELKTQIDNKKIEVMKGATSTTAGASGIVPAPNKGDQVKYLKGDGTWAEIPDYDDMTGASATTAGKHGLVPAPATGDQDKYLKGDGSWSVISIPEVPKYEILRSDKVGEGEGVLVPNSSVNDVALYLRGDGNWSAPIHVGSEAPQDAEVGALWVDTDEASSQGPGRLLIESDIVNDLSTNDSKKVLSAAQGFELNRQIKDAVLITEQTLTDAEKEQARNNIGVADAISAAIGTAMTDSY